MPDEGGKKNIKVLLTGLLIVIALGLALGGTAWMAVHLFHTGDAVIERTVNKNDE